MPTIRYVDVPGGGLWSARQGSGPAMVLLHGGPGMWDYLGPVAATFDDLATTYRYDQRGCGRSTCGPPFDLETAVADLDAVREAWGVERLTVFGHSWGATLALAYAVAHPSRTRAIVYVSGTGIEPEWHTEYRANRAARIPAGAEQRWAELRERLPNARGEERRLLRLEYAELCYATDLGDPSRAAAVTAWLYADGFDVNDEANRLLGADAGRVVESAAFAGRLTRLDVPALVIHGDVDPRPARFAARVAELIPGAELVILPNVGHFPRFEAPEAFDTAVRGFFVRI